MNEIVLTFKKPGLHTTVQDLGRLGYQNVGVPLGGALDRQAAKNANYLVGNPGNTPVLEITLIGPEITFNTDCEIAITGANLSPQLNDSLIENHQLISIKKNDVLSFGKPVSGCRAYLAIAGEWQVTTWLGSASASSFSPELLTPDSLIKKGSTLSILAGKSKTSRNKINKRTPHADILRVRVVPGPEFEGFSQLTIAHFFSAGHIITQDSNRMGYRLGTKLKGGPGNYEMISSGIIPGTIQVTNEYKPIILLADAQTTGGYPRIANVIEEDLDSLAQMKPGSELWFSLA
ncbi:allophanate hydrolase [Marivirga lumbricoides]|uniref:Allophanate hydrolase n=1 Tax=Marivirga lumbricoides TaxID=1046115 RepID=A0A2T4DKS8_9BACT|nr:allophanate hydrolase [Marivirga lumbricoides]